MTDGDVITDISRPVKARGVNNASVLNIGIIPDSNGTDVTPNDAIKPDA